MKGCWSTMCAALILLSAGSSRAATQCPSVYLGHGLKQFDLYEGDPAEVSNVIPDTSSPGPRGSFKNVWRLEAGHRLLAVCSYAGGGERRFALPAGVKQCRSGGIPPRYRAICD